MTRVNPDRTRWPAGHVVSMNTERHKGGAKSTAECECGWKSEAPFRDKAARRRQDQEIEDHWSAVELANPNIARTDGCGRPFRQA